MPIKTPKHLWGFLFIPSPDGGEQKWQERKLQAIISTDFIDLIISDSWCSWALFDVIWNNQLSCLWDIFVLTQTRNFEQVDGRVSFNVSGMYPNSSSVTFLFILLTTNTNSLEKEMATHSTPVFLSGESHGLRSLVGYSPQSHKESDMNEWLHFYKLLSFSESVTPISIPGYCYISKHLHYGPKNSNKIMTLPPSHFPSEAIPHL